MKDILLKNIAHSISTFLSSCEGKYEANSVKESNLPGFLKSYLLDSSDVQSDLLQLAGFLLDKPNSFSSTELSAATSEFMLKTLPYLIVKLPSNFYLLHLDEKLKLIDSLELKSCLSNYFKDLFLSLTKEDILASLASTLTRLNYNFTQVRVQIAVECKSDLKSEIFKELTSKYPNAIITFQIEKKLIGGIRVIADGQMFDFSWTQKIKNLVKII